MQLDPRLLEILACPSCHSPLRADEEASELVCTDAACGLAYPVRDDIPVLLIDEARQAVTVTGGSGRRRPRRTGAAAPAATPAGCCARSRPPARRCASRWSASSTEMLAAVAADGRPRAVVVTGMGGSGIAADVAAAVDRPHLPGARAHPPGPPAARAGSGRWTWSSRCPARAAPRRPSSATDEALRRGARLVTVGAAGSPLAARSDGGRALHLPVDAQGRMPRANLWGLAVPVLMVLGAVGLVELPDRLLPALADQLDADSERFGPVVGSLENPAKALALELAGSLPYVWGASDVANVAAARAAAQLAENAKYPAVHGPLTEVHHNQVVVMAGAFGALAGEGDDDLFRDRVDDAPRWPRMRLVLLRDTDEVPRGRCPGRRVARLAEEYRVPCTELRGDGRPPAAAAGQPGRTAGLRQRVPGAGAGHRPLAHRTRSSCSSAAAAEVSCERVAAATGRSSRRCSRTSASR